MSTSAPSPAVDNLNLSAPEVMLAGPWDRGEFAAARQLARLPDVPPAASTLSAAIELLAGALDPPELLLLATDHPETADQRAVDCLYARAPITRMAIVGGSWCEGQWRTAPPVRGAVRLYWHELAPWWRDSLRRLSLGLAPPWSEALDDVRSGREMDSTATTRSGRGRVLVDAVDYAAFEAIEAGLRAFGFQCEWRPRHRPDFGYPDPGAQLAGGVWIGGQLDGGELASLKDFCTRMPDAATPVIALLDYPRVEHLELIRAVGAAVCLGKPYRLDQLAEALTTAR